MAGRIDGLPLYILCPALPLPCWTMCAVIDSLLKFIRLSDGTWAITRRKAHRVTRHPGLVVLQEDKAVNVVHTRTSVCGVQAPRHSATAQTCKR